MTEATKQPTGREATLAFADAVLRDVNGAPMTEDHKAILANDPRQNPQPLEEIAEPTCSYCC